jgi:hypothetical protein
MHLGRGPPLRSPVTEAQPTVAANKGDDMARKSSNLKIVEQQTGTEQREREQEQALKNSRN